MAEAQAKFVTGNLFGHVTVMSLTTSIGLMAIFLVDFIDMVFISMLGKAELAAAVGYAGAILFFTASFGIGIAIAAGALTARAIGAGETDLARQRATHSVIFGFGFSVLFAILVWINLPFLVRLLGATGITAELAVDYLSIIVPSMPILLLGMTGGAILRAYGNARGSMVSTILAGLVNAVLDPILIFGFGWELTGAAIASVMARITMGTYTFYLIFRDHDGLIRPDVAGLARDFSPIAGIAVPAIMTQLATPVGQAFVTRAMAEFGEAAVAGMAVVARLTPVAFGVVFALSGAVGPIIGQNVGAQDFDRVRRALLDGLLFCGLFVVGVTALLFAIRAPIANLFEAEGVMRQLIYLFCGPLALAFFFNGALFVCNAAFNNLGVPFYSTLVNWGRHTLGTIPFIILGAWLFGAPGVLIGQAIGGVLFALAAYVLARRVVDSAERRSAEGPREDRFTSQIRLFQLFHRNR